MDPRCRIAQGSPFELDVLALLAEHLEDVRRTSSPCIMHALDAAGLAGPEVRFLTPATRTECCWRAARCRTWVTAPVR